jgi:hypothetical protein
VKVVVFDSDVEGFCLTHYDFLAKLATVFDFGWLRMSGFPAWFLWSCAQSNGEPLTRSLSRGQASPDCALI